jgi:hypothetical protein
LELHTEELPHLLPLSSLQFDTAQVVYNQSLSEVARHTLYVGQTGQRRIANEHLPPWDYEAQMQLLRERHTALGEIAVEFLEGLLSKTRYSKHHAQKVLTLLNVYPKSDVLAAMQRAVTYRAFGYSFLERILAHQSTPKPSWQQLSESEQEAIAKLTDSKPIPPRHSQEYQDLLYGKKETSPETNLENPPENQSHESQEPRPQEPRPQEPRSQVNDSDEHGDAQDQNGPGGA